MPVTVQRHLVPTVDDLSHELWPSLHLLAHEEEGRARIRAGEQLEHRWSSLRVRPVIERERYADRPGAQSSLQLERGGGSWEDRCQSMSNHEADDRSATSDALLEIRVRARASHTGIEGTRAGRLLISVSAPPVDDRANEAVCKLIAKTLGLAPSRISIAAGKNRRDKLVRIKGMTLDDVNRRIS